MCDLFIMTVTLFDTGVPRIACLFVFLVGRGQWEVFVKGLAECLKWANFTHNFSGFVREAFAPAASPSIILMFEVCSFVVKCL